MDQIVKVTGIIPTVLTKGGTDEKIALNRWVNIVSALTNLSKRKTKNLESIKFEIIIILFFILKFKF
jgi:hypothetical protein